MRIDDEEGSKNVEDRRGMGPAAIGGGGIVVVLIAVVVAYFMGVDPNKVLAQLNADGGAPSSSAPAQQGAPTDPQGAFAAKVLRSTEEVWTDKLKGAGVAYRPPVLVLYDQAANTACGFGQATMGPFYCPDDTRVYLDLSFFNDLETRFGAPGQAARAYVIAHEIGHHVQTLLGITARVTDAEDKAANETASNYISVRTELQADCFAGVWAKASGRLDGKDIAQITDAAAAIGDDRLQKEAQGRVVPDSFTHGTSEQRQHWFMSGYRNANPADCDTFGTGVPGFSKLAKGGPEDD